MGIIVHAGGKFVPRESLADVITPEATKTWAPIPHDFVVDRLMQSLSQAGFTVESEQHALAREGKQYFGYFQLARDGSINDGYAPVVGLRNAHDKSLPVGLVAGASVFVCDNLAFSGELNLFRKHTAKIFEDLEYKMWKAMSVIRGLFDTQDRRYAGYKDAQLADNDADHLMVQMLRQYAIPAGSFPKLVEQWHKPAHIEHTADGRTAWRLLNAATEVLKSDAESAHIMMPRRTQTVQEILDRFLKPAPTMANLPLLTQVEWDELAEAA